MKDFAVVFCNWVGIGNDDGLPLATAELRVSSTADPDMVTMWMVAVERATLPVKLGAAAVVEESPSL